MNETRLEADAALRNAIIATTSELTKYLVEQRELEQKRWTRSLASTAFFLSMALSYVGVHAWASHNSVTAPKKQPAVDLQRVHFTAQASSRQGADD